MNTSVRADLEPATNNCTVQVCAPAHVTRVQCTNPGPGVCSPRDIRVGDRVTVRTGWSPLNNAIGIVEELTGIHALVRFDGEPIPYGFEPFVLERVL